MADPYWKIKAEIQHELEHVEKVHAAWFSGNASAARDLQSELAGLEEQLEALEAAVSSMVASPERFGLGRIDAFQRQVEVENLRYQYTDLARISKQVLADSSSSSRSFTNIEIGETPGRMLPSACPHVLCQAAAVQQDEPFLRLLGKPSASIDFAPNCRKKSNGSLHGSGFAEVGSTCAALAGATGMYRYHISLRKMQMRDSLVAFIPAVLLQKDTVNA